MKIVSIFGKRLWAFHYEREKKNEYNRLMSLWTNPLYVRDILKNYDLKGKSIDEIAMDILQDSDRLDKAVIATAKDPMKKMEHLFMPLHNQEFQIRLLSKQKAKKNYLRLYAIRISQDCFVITGGAIKTSHLMQDNQLTEKEISKLEKAKSFLQENGISDADSFIEFIIEP